MNNGKKSHTGTLILLIGLITGLTTMHVSADELLIIQERSKGISLTGGDNTLSASESLFVASKGRVWAVKQDAQSSYNVICMNPSEAPVTLSLNADTPWLQTVSGRCSAKGPNVFSCAGENPQATVMCRTQLIANTGSAGGITDMTAVAMRSLDNSDEAFYRIANSVMEQHKLHFDLCSDMHGKHDQGGVSFVIRATGEVENVSVIKAGDLATPRRSDGYGQCMAQAIELWRFPTLDYVYEMEYAFGE